ncbi:MAG TPA: MBL fold metallo-hydrolase [Xanthomonadales bacterium]|nr:MBL fold metallo-hydrolase [Xanthomonadales bacterium]
MAFVRRSFPVGPLQCNCTVLGDTETGTGYVFDPGGNPQAIMATVKELGLDIIGIVHTHAHLDHFLAAGDIRRATGAPIWLHPSDKFLWDSLEQQCTAFGVPFTPQPDPDHWLEHEQDLACGGRCIHTPGHTPGSASFYFEGARLLLAGDTLFMGSVGRTDFPGGDQQALKQSIQQRLYRLDESAVVVTGHGPETSIGKEMRSNAFVRALA